MDLQCTEVGTYTGDCDLLHHTTPQLHKNQGKGLYISGCCKPHFCCNLNSHYILVGKPVGTLYSLPNTSRRIVHLQLDIDCTAHMEMADKAWSPQEQLKVVNQALYSKLSHNTELMIRRGGKKGINNYWFQTNLEAQACIQ